MTVPRRRAAVRPRPPWLVRAEAEFRFTLRATRALIRPFAGLVLVWLLGAVVQHQLGAPVDGPPPTWDEAFFISYCLLLLEHLDHAPPNPIAQVVYYLQPLIGILLLSEGIIKLGLRFMRKEANPRAWVEIMASASRGHVILCGLGTVGVPVFVIERNPDCEVLDRARELGASVLVGDARAEGLLRSLHVDRARAIIVATDDDLANLEIAMDVRDLAPDIHIVMRLFDQRLAQRVKATLGVSVSVSTSRLAAPLFAAAALDPAVINTHRIGEQTMVVIELEVGGALVGLRPPEVAISGYSVLGLCTPPGAWEVPPHPARQLARGDRVQLLVPFDRVEQVHLENEREG